MDDGPIIGLVRAGKTDEAARRLLLEFRRKVFSLVFSILRDRAGAEDVTQEVFIRVWQKLPTFDGRASLGTWIFHIARNTAISAVRTRKSRAKLKQRANPTGNLAVDLLTRLARTHASGSGSRDSVDSETICY